MASGVEPLAAQAWLTSRLTSSADLAAALGVSIGDLSGRVWGGNAPIGSPEPFVLFNEQAPGQDVQGVNATIIMVEPLYTVRVVRRTADASTLQAAAQALHQALHQARSLITVGLVATRFYVSAARERPFYQEYNDDAGHPYRALGGIYRLWVNPQG